MQRLRSIDPATATGRAAELLETVQQAFGTVPNVAKVLVNSPAALGAFLAVSTAMGSAKIGAKLHHQLKLATSEANTCDYCNSILTHLGNKGGIAADDMVEGRKGQSIFPRTDAALKFANTVLETRGRVSDADVQAIRSAGFDDQEIVEIVTSVVVGCFTNFINNVANTTLDIPQAQPLQATAGSR